MENKIQIVIGSWGSYNECNERALGSKWLNLGDYEEWEEIEEELKKEGFILNGIDEELFIQDIEGIDTNGINCDYTHPKTIFEILKKAEILNDKTKYEIMEAFLEVRSFKEFKDLVEKYEEDWDQDIYLYPNKNWYDLGYELMHESDEIPEWLENYIDYEAYGNELSFNSFTEYSNGIIEIR